jgi:TonB family protein
LVQVGYPLTRAQAIFRLLPVASAHTLGMLELGLRGIIMHTISAVLVIGIALAISPAAAADNPPHLDTSGVNMQPAYPASAAAKNERGATVVGVNVGVNGKVNYAYPLQTSGFDDLDSAAITGAMGWHFIPATSNGKNIDGDTAVEIVFQPPDPAGAVAKPPANPPKPAGDFLSKSFQIEAKRGEYETKDGAVLCSNGRMKTTMELLHSEGAAASKWKPSATLIVSVAKDEVALSMYGIERFVNEQEAFIMKHYGGGAHEALQYSHMTDFGKPETVSLTWDSSGLVTATVGALEQHQAKLSAAPTKFSFSASSGVAKFTDSALICLPGSATSSATASH